MKIENPLKGATEYGWHFEQNVYGFDSLIRAIKAGGGSGNIPKIIEVCHETDSDEYDGGGDMQNDSIHLLQDRNLQRL